MGSDARGLRLVLFFTEGVSLREWDAIGMLGREVALYERLAARGVDVTLVTYGDARDLEYAERLKGIRVCCNAAGLAVPRGAAVLPWIPEDVLRAAHVIKTNQMAGADKALAAARAFGKPLVARQGYLWSEFAARKHGPESREFQRADRIERAAYAAAAQVVVTTEAMRASVLARVPAARGRIAIVPNYVDVERFSPGYALPAIPRVCYVGRLDQSQKNIGALLAAVGRLDVPLTIVGDGPERDAVAAACGSRRHWRWQAAVAHERLPEALRAARVFVLPSRFEGHPKALLEAMACGLPVVAGDVPGVNDLVRHGKTGWLVEPTAEGLRAGLARVLADAGLARRLGAAAREDVVTRCGLERIVEMELAVYAQVCAQEAAYVG